MSHIIKNLLFAYAKTKAQISYMVTAQLISTWMDTPKTGFLRTQLVHTHRLSDLIAVHTDYLVAQMLIVIKS